MFLKPKLKLTITLIALSFILSETLTETEMNIDRISLGSGNAASEDTSSQLKNDHIIEQEGIHYSSNPKMLEIVEDSTLVLESENLRKKRHTKNIDNEVAQKNETLNITNSESNLLSEPLEELSKRHKHHHSGEQESNNDTNLTDSSNVTNLVNESLINNSSLLSITENEKIFLDDSSKSVNKLIENDISNSENISGVLNTSSKSRCFDTCVEKCKITYEDILEIKQCSIKACLCEEAEIKNLISTKEESFSFFNFLIDTLIVFSIISLSVSLAVIGFMIYRGRESQTKYESLHDSLNLDFSKEIGEDKIEQKIFESNYELMTTDDFDEREICIRDF